MILHNQFITYIYVILFFFLFNAHAFIYFIYLHSFSELTFTFFLSTSSASLLNEKPLLPFNCCLFRYMVAQCCNRYCFHIIHYSLFQLLFYSYRIICVYITYYSLPFILPYVPTPSFTFTLLIFFLNHVFSAAFALINSN